MAFQKVFQATCYGVLKALGDGKTTIKKEALRLLRFKIQVKEDTQEDFEALLLLVLSPIVERVRIDKRTRITRSPRSILRSSSLGRDAQQVPVSTETRQTRP
jgi:hypothetical protein